jgi:hypothetical protein
LVGAPTAPVGQTSPHVFTYDNIVAGVEQSLRWMKADYLDVVQFHIEADAGRAVVGTTNLTHRRDNRKAPLPAKMYAEAKRRLRVAGPAPASP